MTTTRAHGSYFIILNKNYAVICPSEVSIIYNYDQWSIYVCFVGGKYVYMYDLFVYKYNILFI